MLRIAVRLAFLTASVIALPVVRGHGRRSTDHARQISRHARRLQRLPHAGILLREARHVTLSRRLGCGLRDSGPRCLCRPNITPDKETGIGSWTPEQIVTAIQTGERPDGRILAPIMPWHAFAQLTADDAMAIAAFLQSLNPVSNQVPGPFRPGEKVSTFMFRILPPGETAAAAAK